MRSAKPAARARGRSKRLGPVRVLSGALFLCGKPVTTRQRSVSAMTPRRDVLHRLRDRDLTRVASAAIARKQRRRAFLGPAVPVPERSYVRCCAAFGFGGERASIRRAEELLDLRWTPRTGKYLI